MLSAYERHLILFYLSNAFSRLRSRDEEAKNLLRWLRKHEDQLEIPYPHTAGDDAEGAVGHKLPDEEVPDPGMAPRRKGLKECLGSGQTGTPGPDGDAAPASRKGHSSLPDRHCDPGTDAALQHSVPCRVDDR